MPNHAISSHVKSYQEVRHYLGCRVISNSEVLLEGICSAKKVSLGAWHILWHIPVSPSHQNGLSLMTSHALHANICTDLNLGDPPLDVPGHVVSSRVKLNGSHLGCD